MRKRKQLAVVGGERKRREEKERERKRSRVGAGSEGSRGSEVAGRTA